MKLAFIVGARPNFIKIAPIFDIIKNYNKLQPILIHTGQHYDSNMSDIFFDELQIPKPDFFLNVSPSSQTQQTAEIMMKLEELFIQISPDYIVVIGDVSSTVAAALVASKLHIRVAHIEAGLRSFNKSMPEEINRIVTDHISDILFAPSPKAIENLNNEGLGKKSYFTGDIMFDAVIRNLPIANSIVDILDKLQLQSKGYIFATLHRPYNVDDPIKLKNIIKELSDLDYKIVFPIHPRTHSVIKSNNIILNNNFITINPVGYFESLILQKNSYRVITDSGGMQKEAFFLKTPCITLRPETEWTETIEAGANVLSDIAEIQYFVNNYHFNMNMEGNPYGDGNASQIILNLLDNLN